MHFSRGKRFSTFAGARARASLDVHSLSERPRLLRPGHDNSIVASGALKKERGEISYGRIR